MYFTGKFTRNLWAADDNLIWDEDAGIARDRQLHRATLPAPGANIAQRNYFRTDVGLRRNMADR